MRAARFRLITAEANADDNIGHADRAHMVSLICTTIFMRQSLLAGAGQGHEGLSLVHYFLVATPARHDSGRDLACRALPPCAGGWCAAEPAYSPGRLAFTEPRRSCRHAPILYGRATMIATIASLRHGADFASLRPFYQLQAP